MFPILDDDFRMPVSPTGCHDGRLQLDTARGSAASRRGRAVRETEGVLRISKRTVSLLYAATEGKDKRRAGKSGRLTTRVSVLVAQLPRWTRGTESLRCPHT
ncbi:hypothetical protein AAFF_G00423390 [Aldrovandia affinis]|uniref:Uncharacterized protein n=1 Tax=Aldrovandia affinis TaxID=143900 RepID=A0AAD7T6I1_9TELE|nr:hypothetical protein AAFF_G00423390 [Aldrovandia affinis]